MPTIYIETTIPSFYFETRRTRKEVLWREITRSWWDSRRRRYDLVTSDVVFAELQQAPATKASACRELLNGITVLNRPARTNEVVAYYQEHRLMPRASVADAAHLAIASLHGVEYLLTWNCSVEMQMLSA